MQKRKRWQFFLIVAVIALTIYNILPTVFYYTKPLRDPIDAPRGEKTAHAIVNRVNNLEEDSLSWISSFCQLLHIKPLSIELDKQNPRQIIVDFSSKEAADTFRQYLPRAGSLIVFTPSQLNLGTQKGEDFSKKVFVQRQIPVRLEDKSFAFSFKFDKENHLSPLYKEVLFDRVAHIASSIGGLNEKELMIETILARPNSPASSDLLYDLAHDIVDFSSTFGSDSPILTRYFSHLFTKNGSHFKDLIQLFDHERDLLKMAKASLQKEEKASKEKSGFAKQDFAQNLKLLEKKETLLLKAESALKGHEKDLVKGKNVKTYENFFSELIQNYHPDKNLITISFGDVNPFIAEMVLDIKNDKLFLRPHKDVRNLITSSNVKVEQLLIDELAKITRETDESINPHGKEFVISLSGIGTSKSFLALKIDEIAKAEASQMETILKRDWKPKHAELTGDAFPIVSYEAYLRLPEEQKTLCLVVFAPLASTSVKEGLKNNSIYVIAKGLDRIMQKYSHGQKDKSEQEFLQDIASLRQILERNGYFGYSGESIPLTANFKDDLIFQREDFFQTLLKATRENFQVKGSKKYAQLEFSDVEQRILATNQIESKMHEDLLKWKDDYHAAQVSIDPRARFDIPAPTKSVLLDNIALSTRKYFRGDDKKILHWGLDLSGGKTVQIELRDPNNRIVKGEAELKQGANELYNRVNKMGVSEVSIRVVDSSIVLDFPGSQGLSAADLIKASSMYFHVVNEKFSPMNPALASHVNRFLQEIWNEAVVTNKKDSDSIQLIAWKHLYGDTLNPDIIQPRSESAKILYENGLRLASFADPTTSSSFNDTVSKIAILRGNDFSQWMGQTHPLLLVFHHYALEGSNLDNIRSAYDPSKGNFLTFDVKSSSLNKDKQKIYPRDELYAWTSHFSKEKISGTPLEAYSHGKGWRMAVILNDTIISSPHLEASLRDSAMITGSFSQREINQLVADLKAGSLSYTPHILSEKNVSPELGLQERVKGIAASAVALVLVIATMIIYYRFSGLVASIALFFNLLILWATLQNLQATLTLAGIAGIILTVGMAVDANVLVFERIREELTHSNRMISAIQNGYKRAFSAIFDSNVTTIIAALILLNFDSGPIKSFAVTLLIGIVSSLFTALFCTKAFFQKWAENPAHTTLKMMNLIKSSSFDFLKSAKYAIAVSVLVTIVGSFMLVVQRHAIFGMDFMGGYSVSFEIKEKPGLDYRQVVEKALLKQGATIKDFQIRELSSPQNIQLLLGMGLEQKERPFHGLPLQTDKKEISFSYENNPRLVWIVASLQKEGLTLTERSLSQLDSTWTAMSGQMSDSMRNNAIIGMAIALICIFLYITFRFEFTYATSAIVCLLHDIIICLGAIAILNYLHVPIQIDLHTVAAIMTIIGFSLNDTIIVFDRIREELKIKRQLSYREVINYALNVTLSRTMLTSGTTLMMLFALVILGGSTIFSFSLVMAIGVIFGTLSSLFIATPCLLWLHKYEKKKEEKEQSTPTHVE